MKKNNTFDKLCKSALNTSINAGAGSRIEDVLDEEIKKITNSGTKPIMTIEEIADYLRVTPDIIENHLGEIPCFELGGHLLFRKESVDGWISKKENSYKFDVMEFKLNRDTKITTA